MKRRELIAGVGSLTAGSSVAIGSGAFTSVNANRDIDVRIAEDDKAYLRLKPIRADFAREDDGSLVLTIDDDLSTAAATNDDVDSEDTGDGVGTDSVYSFDDIFTIQNQGTNGVRVFGIYQGGEVNLIEIYNSSDEMRRPLTESNPSTILDPGETISAGVKVNTHGTPVREDPYDESIIIGADAAESG